VKTVGSYWPYATTLFDYVRRTMPFTNPQSLSNDEVYALTAYLLSLNGIVPSDAVMDAKALPRVEMPNRKSFVPDPRPDVK
jgi:cytochrome c